MRARGWAIVLILVVAAGVGGYALHGGFGRGGGSASNGAAGASPFARGGGGGPGGGGGGFPGGFGGRSETGATITVQSVKITSGPLVAQRTATGTVVPVTQSNVAAQASGTVKSLLVGVGDDVTANQPLVQLTTDTLELAVANAKTSLSTAQINLQSQQTNIQQATTQLQSQLSSAQSALAAAQANYASAQKVYALGGTSKASVDSAKSQLDQAQANVTSAENALSQNQRAQTESLQQLKLGVTQAENGLKQAELNLANATIRAPFAGQVASFAVAPGEYVGPSTAVATLVSLQRQVQLTVPPSDASAFAAGTKLTFANSVRQLPITITQRPGAPVNQGVTVTAAFDPKSVDAASLPAVGEVGTVSYRVTLATATLVPITAIQNDGTNTFVFVITGGKAVQTNLTILAQAGNDAAVTGVPSGVTIVDQPPPGLLNGSSVTTAGGSAGGAAGGAAGARGGAPAGNANGTQNGNGYRGGAPAARPGPAGTNGAGTNGAGTNTRPGSTTSSPAGAAGNAGRTSGGGGAAAGGGTSTGAGGQ